MILSDRPGGQLPTRRLFGLDFVADATIGDIVDVIISPVDRSAGWQVVVTPNVDHIVSYERDEQHQTIARSAALVLPDGMPIVWLSRLVRRPLRRRLTGTDLFHALWLRLADDSRPVVVVAPSESVGELLAQTHAGVHVIVPPDFAVADQGVVSRLADEVTVAARAHGAHHILVAISAPKAHAVAAEMRRAHGTEAFGWVLLVGAAAEFHIGTRRRAPPWMQRIGLEWLHRLVNEPRRLARRYLVDGRHFFRIAVTEWRRR